MCRILNLYYQARRIMRFRTSQLVTISYNKKNDVDNNNNNKKWDVNIFFDIKKSTIFLQFKVALLICN